MDAFFFLHSPKPKQKEKKLSKQNKSINLKAQRDGNSKQNKTKSKKKSTEAGSDKVCHRIFFLTLFHDDLRLIYIHKKKSHFIYRRKLRDAVSKLN